jgi:hypothetical protein
MGVIQKQKIAASGSSCTVIVGAAEGCDLLIFVGVSLLAKAVCQLNECG